MTQADKMQLRMLAILDQSKVAWGDQANTISSVANQYRILKQQISNLSRVIGNLFLPIVQKVLPVVNGLIVALQRLFTTLGFKLFGNNWLTGIMDGISSGYSGDDTLGELEEDANNVSDSLGNAANEAKKLKGQLQGFDELNNLTSTQTTDSGSTGDSNADSGIDLSGAISDSLAEYESVWDKALADSQNKAQGYADTISSMFTNMWSAIEPFRNSISNLWDNGLSKLADFTWTSLGDFYDNFLVPIGTWAFGTEDSGFTRLVNIINDSLMAIDWDKLNSSLSAFWTAIEPYAEQFGEGLIDFFEDISGLAVDVINLFPGALDGITGALNRGDPENARNWGYSLGVLAVGIMALKPAIALTKGISALVAVISTIATGGWFAGAGVLAQIGNSLTMIALGAGTVSEVLSLMFTPIQGIIALVGGLVIAVANFFSMWENGFSWLKEALMVIGIALAAVGAVILGVAAAPAVVVAAIVAAAATIAVVVHDNWDAICNWFSKAADWFDSKVITPICDFFKGLWESVSGFFVNLWNDIVGVWENVSGWFNDNVISPIVTVFEGFKLRISQVFEGLWIIVQAVWIVASTWFNENIVTPIVTAFNFLKDKVSEAFNYLWSGIKGVWSVVAGWFNTNIIAPVSNAFNVLRVAVSGAFNYLWSGIKGVWSGVANWFSNTVINPVRNAWQSATSAIGGFFNSLWSGIKWGVGSAMNSVIYGIESAINWIVSGINGIIGGFNKIVSVAAKIVGANWSGVSRLSRVYLGRVSMYADGGLPNTGEMFVARENGPELVGNIGNHSAVANNDQIVEGIRSGVSDANQETNTLLREQNNLLMRLLEKDTGISTRDIFNAVRSEDKAYRNINGHSALEY